MTNHTVLRFEIEVRANVWNDNETVFKDTRRTFKNIHATSSSFAMKDAIDKFTGSFGNVPREPVIKNVKLISISV